MELYRNGGICRHLVFGTHLVIQKFLNTHTHTHRHHLIDRWLPAEECRVFIGLYRNTAPLNDKAIASAFKPNPNTNKWPHNSATLDSGKSPAWALCDLLVFSALHTFWSDRYKECSQEMKWVQIGRWSETAHQQGTKRGFVLCFCFSPWHYRGHHV